MVNLDVGHIWQAYGWHVLFVIIVITIFVHWLSNEGTILHTLVTFIKVKVVDQLSGLDQDKFVKYTFHSWIFDYRDGLDTDSTIATVDNAHVLFRTFDHECAESRFNQPKWFFITIWHSQSDHLLEWNFADIWLFSDFHSVEPFISLQEVKSAKSTVKAVIVVLFELDYFNFRLSRKFIWSVLFCHIFPMEDENSALPVLLVVLEYIDLISRQLDSVLCFIGVKPQKLRIVHPIGILALHVQMAVKLN